jgi:uncharacterized protein (TIGR03067 family)
MKRSIQSILLSILSVFVALSFQAAQPSEDSTFSLAPGDVTEAAITTSGGARLQVTLTPEKSVELQTFTTRNVNKQVRIMVGGKLRSEPFIREPIAGPAMEIFVNSPEDAVATVKTLMTSTVKFEQLYKWTDSRGRTHYSEKPPPQESVPSPSLQPIVEDKNALQALHGSWAVTNATMNGRPARDVSLLSGNWTFRGNELNLESPQKGKARFTLKLDAKAKAFQLTPVEPATEASGWMLFSREGANLKLAFYDNLEGRPESFEPRTPRAKPELIVVTLSPKK